MKSKLAFLALCAALFSSCHENGAASVVSACVKVRNDGAVVNGPATLNVSASLQGYGPEGTWHSCAPGGDSGGYYSDETNGTFQHQLPITLDGSGAACLPLDFRHDDQGNSFCHFNTVVIVGLSVTHDGRSVPGRVARIGRDSFGVIQSVDLSFDFSHPVLVDNANILASLGDQVRRGLERFQRGGSARDAARAIFDGDAVKRVGLPEGVWQGEGDSHPVNAVI